MNKKETAKLLAMICAAYPRVDLTPEQAEIWAYDMQDVPFEPAMKRFEQYRRTNKFPPTIADIYEVAIEQRKHDREEIDEWYRLHGSAEPLPTLKRGDDDGQ